MADRMHGGASLQHIPLATPGFMGLNSEMASGLLGPEWATELDNAIIDGNNRLAGRLGWSDLTTNPNADPLVSGFEYLQHDGTAELIYATDNATIVRSVDDGVSFSDVTGSAVFTEGTWQWLNFADRAIGIQSGKQPIVYTGTSFSHISDTANEPTGGAGTAFGGRLWIADIDGSTLKYCSLLDETDWSGSDTGSWNFQNVWKGTDTIQAVGVHNGALVVFGKRNVLFLTDGAGSTLGLNPLQAYVADVISGVGCIARDSVQNVDGDLWFLSESGLVSLGRLIQERSNPINNLSKNVRSEMMDDVNDTNFDTNDIRSVYSPIDRFYLLSLPRASGSTEVGKTWVFDTRAQMPDGAARCLGKWQGLVPQTLILTEANALVSSNLANAGELFQYTSFRDDLDPYTFVYRSGWTDLGAPGIKKLLKRFAGVFFADTEITIGFKWAWDFGTEFATRNKTFPAGGGTSQWDLGLWGTAVWGGGESTLRDGKVVPGGSGEYIKWGIDATIDGTEFSIQQLELFAKLGRLG